MIFLLTLNIITVFIFTFFFTYVYLHGIWTRNKLIRIHMFWRLSLDKFDIFGQSIPQLDVPWTEQLRLWVTGILPTMQCLHNGPFYSASFRWTDPNSKMNVTAQSLSQGTTVSRGQPQRDPVRGISNRWHSCGIIFITRRNLLFNVGVF